ncbi:periplasmic nitrate reductase, NapE protein [Pseudoxanthomonas sp. Root630]|uniref:periplasmic nitrate reductase, NapE protein n=1 Tax=Pseudoxanthomonas sp. Root630 TaxID=1736574 RepID=UPI000703AEA9|nr:periplasmic nitrate reductase, NapE protein [Pseudoxanthomonas sp. Root630]KRA45253.1 nitrate reductase [Pseudoxanthomonas sp. Root630]
MEQSEGTAVASKQQERLAFLLLTVVIFPLMAVLIVAGYGFLVWMWQLLFSGPPTGP